MAYISPIHAPYCIFRALGGAAERAHQHTPSCRRRLPRTHSCGHPDVSARFMRTVLSFRTIHADCPIVQTRTCGLSEFENVSRGITRADCPIIPHDSCGLSYRSEAFMRTARSFPNAHKGCPHVRTYGRARTTRPHGNTCVRDAAP